MKIHEPAAGKSREGQGRSMGCARKSTETLHPPGSSFRYNCFPAKKNFINKPNPSTHFLFQNKITHALPRLQHRTMQELREHKQGCAAFGET